MNEPRLVIEPLGPEHDRASFSCGEPALDSYIRRQASQDARRRVAQVFVAVGNAPGEIAGYYTLSAASFEKDELPADLAKRLPHYPVPAAVLGTPGHRQRAPGTRAWRDPAAGRGPPAAARERDHRGVRDGRRCEERPCPRVLRAVRIQGLRLHAAASVPSPPDHRETRSVIPGQGCVDDDRVSGSGFFGFPAAGSRLKSGAHRSMCAGIGTRAF